MDLVFTFLQDQSCMKLDLWTQSHVVQAKSSRFGEPKKRMGLTSPCHILWMPLASELG